MARKFKVGDFVMAGYQHVPGHVHVAQIEKIRVRWTWDLYTLKVLSGNLKGESTIHSKIFIIKKITEKEAVARSI